MSLASQIKLLIATFCWLLLRYLVPCLPQWVFEAIPLLALFWLICRSIWPWKALASSPGHDPAHKCDGQATVSVSLVQVEGDSTSGATESGASASAQTIRPSSPSSGEEEDRGHGGVECQCCFEYYPFAKMVRCPEAHLFCSSCISTHTSVKLDAYDCSINCLHLSGCVLPFPPSELERVPHPKPMSYYKLVKRQKEVEAASLEGQIECKENLFRCGNEQGPCGVVGCGMCQEEELLPKSRKDSVEEDKLLEGRHGIEEAMTRALIRNCPKCQKAFVKELGCNKMMCPKCLTLSCYVCRQIITGYEHFDLGPASTNIAGAKCLLWDSDSVEERHADEVEKAAERAIREYKQAHPDVDESAIKVDLPPEPPRTNDLAPGLLGYVPAFPYPFPALYPPGYNPYAANILPPAGGLGPAYDPLMGFYQPPYFGPPVPVEQNRHQYPMVDRLQQDGLIQPGAPATAPDPPSQSLSSSLPGLRGFFNKPRPQPKPGQSSKCTQDTN